MYVCACLNVGVDVCTRMLVVVTAHLPPPTLFICLFVCFLVLEIGSFTDLGLAKQAKLAGL